MHARYMKHAREKAKTIAASHIRLSHAEVDIATDVKQAAAQAKRFGLTSKVITMKGPGGGNPLMRFDGPQDKLKKFLDEIGYDEDSGVEIVASSSKLSRKVKLKFINTAEAKDAQKKLSKFSPKFDGQKGLTIEVMNDAEEKEARKAAGIKASHVTIACASIKPYTMDVVIDLDDEEVQSTVESYSNTAYGPVTAKKLSGNKWRLTAAAAAPLWKIMREHQLKGKVMQDGMNVQPPSGVMHDVAKLNK